MVSELASTPTFEGKPMRLLLADDHHLVRDALKGLLLQSDPEMDIVTACDLPEALQHARGRGPFDIVLLDLKMPGMNGLEGVRKMIDQDPDLPVVLMSGAASSVDVHTALELGIRGYIPKTMTGRALFNAIRLVADGDTYLPSDFMLGGQSGSAPILTQREHQVLAELRQGNSNKEIARTLDISEATVKLHVRSLSKKLDARNRTDIVIRAIDMSLV